MPAKEMDFSAKNVDIYITLGERLAIQKTEQWTLSEDEKETILRALLSHPKIWCINQNLAASKRLWRKVIDVNLWGALFVSAVSIANVLINQELSNGLIAFGWMVVFVANLIQREKAQ